MGFKFGDAVMYKGTQCTYIGYSRYTLGFRLIVRPSGGWQLTPSRQSDILFEKDTHLLNKALAGGFTDNLYWVYKLEIEAVTDAT